MSTIPATTRPDRCLPMYLPADRPDLIAENADLAAEVARGRPSVAQWQADHPDGHPRIVVVLGPVPERVGREEARRSPLFLTLCALLAAWTVLAPVTVAVVAHALSAW